MTELVIVSHDALSVDHDALGTGYLQRREAFGMGNLKLCEPGVVSFKSLLRPVPQCRRF